MHEIKEKNSLDFYLISTNLDSKLKCIEDSTGTLTLLNSSSFFFTYCFFNFQMILNSLFFVQQMMSNSTHRVQTSALQISD
jgi:hypothetical protein